MSAAAAVAVAIAEAIKASGAIVRVAPSDFASILDRSEKPLVVYARGGFLAPPHQYLTAYKGLIFYTKTKQPFEFLPDVELVIAKKIWIPG